jgi:iron complex outermembrane receptor protein
MCGQNPTINKTPTYAILPGAFAAAGLAFAGLVSAPANAQDEFDFVLDEIVTTAQKREESLQDVPISVATLAEERYEVLFSGGEDILALSGRVPGLYAESSNGRAAPRFYMRGLGNIDFDLAASQPVSIVMDEVVMENTVLKSFPLFDMQNVEVIRGPQGTLFGRNTIAGIIKFNTRRPDHETSGYLKGSWATYDTMNLEGAVGGSLIDDKLSVRVSGLARSRDDWITNGHTGQKSLGDYSEYAGRVQLHWTPNDTLSALLSHQSRNMDGTASIFRANVFTTGSASLNQNYDRETVWYDGGDDNPQGYQGSGTTLNLQWTFDKAIVSSITSVQEAFGSSRGDIDAGVIGSPGATPPPGLTSGDLGGGVFSWPGFIPFPSVTEDGADVDQFTQEFRISSLNDGPFNWQIGAFFFDSKLTVTTFSFASEGFVDVQDTIIEQTNKTWAVFGQGTYELSDALTLTAGVRYTDDEKDFQVLQFPQLWLDLGIPTFIADPVNASDGQASGEIALNWALSDDTSLYARYANGFRAQTIQGRDVAFLGGPTVATPETINSIEAGFKADFWDNRGRLNVGVFSYEVDDMQFSVIGGASNVNQVINAEKGEATGMEIEADILFSENFLVSAGVAFNDTEIKDSTLSTKTCGSGQCTVLDPLDTSPGATGEVLIDGNPFPRAPEMTYNLSARFAMPLGASAELYVFTDWAWYGEINMPLYEAVEFKTKDQFEGGLRIGYQNFDTGWEVAVFGRNITDEDNVLGFIDFNNNTGFVNEPSVWGIEVGKEFGD